MKTRQLGIEAAEGLLEALRELSYLTCTWCGAQTMTPVKGFLENGGWALLYHCETCRGEHIEHSGMWGHVDRRPRAVSTDRTDRAGEGGGDRR